jgi:asparagine synthase (glutamine-hydrolysing)
MCGIAGIFHPDVPKPVDPARVEAMISVLEHRGPDGGGVWTAPGIGLGHRRLSIIDLSEAAAQPMLTADRRVAASYNGEIYNFREVRAELEGQGHVFATESDTEVILAAWRQWGPQCLDRFNGMFAFALYDADSDSLFLARDRLGVKPLHYSVLADGALIFASELKGLLAHPGMRRSPSLTAVEDYLAFGYVPDDASIVEGVSKLPAGHYLLVRRGRTVPRPAQYWDIDFMPGESRGTKALEAEMVERLREAVRSRMVADVPLGAFLSGGVDSSAVVAFMAEMSREAVETCSIGFDAVDHDETRYAAMVAEGFATHHRSRIVMAADFALLDTLAGAFDEPFADASALATYRVCETGAREGEGLPLGRRRRRGDGRVSPLPDVRRRGAGPPVPSGAAIQRRRGAWPGLSETGLGTAISSRQDDAPGARPEQRRSLCGRGRRHAAGASRGPVQRQFRPRPAGPPRRGPLRARLRCRAGARPAVAGAICRP